ncbi:MAG: GIY-YIG nuclease family protein [Ferruginibacter sp.]
MNAITDLDLFGIYNALDFEKINEEKRFRSPGVYIWGTNNETLTRFTPLYVGIHTNNILLRIQEHFMNLHFGNKYPIFKESFYDDLIQGKDLIPKVPHIDRIKEPLKKKYSSYQRYIKDCIFQCSPAFIFQLLEKNLTLPYMNLLSHTKANSITSQGYDFQFGGKYSLIQPVINTYFSKKRFSFMLIPISEENNKGNVPLKTMEGNIKMSLKYGSISRSNSFNTSHVIRLNEKNANNFIVSDYFLLNDQKCLTSK